MAFDPGQIFDMYNKAREQDTERKPDGKKC